MKISPPLSEARLIRRYKRFLADVILADGTETTLHCPNTGSMKNCQPDNARVWYSKSDNPKRKYPFTWELVELPVSFSGVEGNVLAGINTGRSNHLVKEAIASNCIDELLGYDVIRSEVRYGQENSRVDLLLQKGSVTDCYVEVKNVTLAENNGLGLFPDAVTTRGQKHLRELMEMVAEGYRAVLFFCVQHTGIKRVAPADDIDPEYGQMLRKAVAAGVEVLAYSCVLAPDEIRLDQRIPVDL